MDIFLSVLCGIALVVFLVLGIIFSIRKKNAKDYHEKYDGPKPKLWFILSVVSLVALLIVNSITIVPTGYTGVKTAFGQINERPASQGFNWKIPFVETIQLVNNKQQLATFEGQIWGETSEKIEVFGENVAVTYRVAPESSAWIYANVASGTSNLIPTSDVSSSLKDAMTRFDATKVTIRSEIEPAARNLLNEALTVRYGKNVVEVIKITIPQMGFLPEYDAAIQKKANAAKDQETKAIENQTALDKAESDKQIRIKDAEAEAEEKRIKAESDAQARLIQVEAEAEANRKINETMTDTVLKNKFYNVWNGQLPKVMGEGTVITNIAD